MFMLKTRKLMKKIKEEMRKHTMFEDEKTHYTEDVNLP